MIERASKFLRLTYHTLLAMKRAVMRNEQPADKVLVDGNHAPKLDIPVEAIVKGDAKIPAISAASILAKVARDEAMIAYHDLYPEYGFNVHNRAISLKRTYGSPPQTHGPCAIHRKTYSPIRQPDLFD